jgi:hypothetical protein
MQLDYLLAAIAVIVILGLAFYAGILISKIKIQTKRNEQQKAAQQEKKQQRNDNICDSIRVIAIATTQKQCNVSEAAIRLNILLETLVLEAPIDVDKEYPALSALFNKVKSMPTHEKRKEVPTKELKKLDQQRLVFEAEFEEKIIAEASLLVDFSV